MSPGLRYWDGERWTEHCSPAPAEGQPVPTGPPAGWYPDPTGQAAYRYWDGDAWTDQASGEPQI